MRRRIIIYFPLVVYLTLLLIVLVRLFNSVSPLQIMKIKTSENDSLHGATFLALKPPFISDGNEIFCVAGFRTVKSDKQAICRIYPEKKYIQIFQEHDNVSIHGYSSSARNKLILFSDQNDRFNFFQIQDDTVYKTIETPLLQNETVVSVNLTEGIPEFVTIMDSTQSLFRKYSYKSGKDQPWDLRELKPNSFFQRIGTPLGAYYYRDNWYFLLSSYFYRRDSLYVEVPGRSSNVLVFRNNLSYHFDDIRISNHLIGRECLDNTFSGIINHSKNCEILYTFQKNTSEFSVINSPDNNRIIIPVFLQKDKQLQVYGLYKTTNEKEYYFRMDDDEVPLTYSTSEHSGKTVFSFPEAGDPEFAMTSSVFSDAYFIPFEDSFLFILDNGQYCITNDKAERIDDVNFRFKIRNFINLFSGKLKQYPEQFSSYSIPVIIAGYPAMIICVLFLFFIIRVFLTPHRPAYSSRRKRTTPVKSYLVFGSVLYLITTIVFLFSFFSILKTI